ncbi:MAG: hypothetical protein WCH34_09185 [Bacteroidota bacterium]
MKKRIFYLSRFIILIFFLFIEKNSIAQLPFFNLELRNDVQVTDRMYEFDIYLTHTGNYIAPTTFELSSIQMGIYFNSAILNGGTAMATPILDSLKPLNPFVSPFYQILSDINTNQKQTPNHISIVDSSNNYQTIKITAKTSFPGDGTIISRTSGTRVMRVRITNSVAFANFKPNLSWSFDIPPSWPTKVNAYVDSVSKNITANGTFLTSGLSNPLLNVANSYHLTGGGTYCSGGIPVVIGLDSSQTVFSYQLKKDGLNYGASVAGTGHSLSWNITEAGTYTCTANGISMNGNPVVSVTTTSAPDGNANQSFSHGATVADLAVNGSSIKWYDAATGGNLLLLTDTLMSGSNYYASQTLGGCESQNRFAVSVSIIQTINIRLFLQGLFDNNTNSMLEANDIDWGSGNVHPNYGSGVADKIQIDLFEENSPYQPIGVSMSNLDLSTSGLATFQMVQNHRGNYYIRIRNRNHLEIWSAHAVPFNRATVNYNFTTNAYNAYQAPGGNDPQIQVSLGIFALYLGDLDQSLGVDFDDFNVFEPYLNEGTYGFSIADFNGNALVDFDDFNLFEPMLNFGPFAQYPGMP